MGEEHLSCVACGARYPCSLVYECADCGDILELVRDERSATFLDGLVCERVSLGEGATPLLRAPDDFLAQSGFSGQLWFKDETRNPSGSFKDRHVAAALTRAIALGAKGVVCASSGNAGASAAAYAARAGLPAVIVVPQRTPLEKMTQICAYGARLIKVEGHYSNSYDFALRIAREAGYVNLTTTYINPYGTDALRLVGRELFDQLDGDVPDWVLVPTGAGPLVKGVVQGFADKAEGMPRVVAVQAEGCAPVVAAYDRGLSAVAAWGEPDTIASGISDPLIGYEKDGSHTLRLVRETGGGAVAVSDDEIRAAMRRLAAGAGIFAEPTAASAVAAAGKMTAAGTIDRKASVVCMITGHGFKDFGIYRRMRMREISVAAGASLNLVLGERGREDAAP